MNEDFLINTTFNYYEQKKQYMIKTALKHEKASKIGSEEFPADYCQCCKQNSNKIPFKKNCNINNFSSLGRGYCLYFKTIEYIKLFIQFVFIFCMIFEIAFKKKEIGKINQNIFLDEFFFYLLIIFVFWIEFKIKIYEKKLMEISMPDISDFSVMISDLKSDNIFELENLLREFLNKLNNQNGILYDPYDMAFCFRCDVFIKQKKKFFSLKNKILDLNEKIFFFYNNEKTNEKFLLKKEELSKEIKIVNKKLEGLWANYDKIKNGGNCEKVFTGKIFITFDDHKIALDFLEKYESERYKIFNYFLYFLNKIVKKIKRYKKRNLLKKQGMNFKDFFIYKKNYYSFKNFFFKKNLFFQNKKIYVTKAVNPKNINWKNIHYNFYHKKIRRFFVFTISSIFLIFSFILVLLINQFRYEFLHKSTKPKKINLIFNLSISLLILFFNMILTILIEKTIKLEIHVKKTGELSSIIKKVILKMFLNASMAILIISIKEVIIIKKFLFSQLFTFTYACIFFYPIINFLDPFFIYFLIRKKKYDNKNKINITQKKLNEIFAPPKYNIIMHYSAFIFFLFHFSLFLTFFPICISFSVFLFYTIYYQVQKYLFIKRYSSCLSFKNDLNYHIVKIFKYIPCVYLFGNFVKSVFYLKKEIYFWYFIFKVFVAFIIVILPDDVLKIFFFIPNHYFGFLDNYPNLLNLSVFYNQHNPANSTNFEL